MPGDPQAIGVIERFDAAKKDRAPYDTVYDRVAWYSYPEVYDQKNKASGKSNTETQESVRPEDTQAGAFADILAKYLYANTFSKGNELFSIRIKQKWDESDDDFESVQKKDEVQEWTAHAARVALHAIQDSNFPSIAEQGFRNYVLYGPMPINPSLEEVDEGVHELVFKHQNIYDNFYITEGEDGRIDGCVLELNLTANKAIERYKSRFVGDDIRKAAKDSSRASETFRFIAEIRRNPRYLVGSKRKDRKKYILLEVNAKEQAVVKSDGFDLFPWQVPRFSKLTRSAYGTSPFIQMLPTIRELNKLLYDIRQLANLAGKPPVFTKNDENIESSLIRPGEIIPLDTTDPVQQAVVPYPVNVQGLQVLLDMYLRLSDQLREGFLLDMFFNAGSLADQSSQPVTATQASIDEQRRIEGIAGVINRLQDEFYSPMVEYVVHILTKAGYIKQPPAILKGRQFKVVYSSRIDNRLSEIDNANLLLAAQEIAQLGILEAQVPELKQVINLDAARRQVARNRGVDPDFVYTEIESSRLRREEEAMQAQALQRQELLEKLKPIDAQKRSEKGSIVDQQAGV